MCLSAWRALHFAKQTVSHNAEEHHRHPWLPQARPQVSFVAFFSMWRRWPRARKCWMLEHAPLALPVVTMLASASYCVKMQEVYCRCICYIFVAFAVDHSQREPRKRESTAAQRIWNAHLLSFLLKFLLFVHLSHYSENAKSIKIKKAAGVTKFKIRLPTYLYTLKVADAEKADKLVASLPPKLARTDL